MEPYKNDNSLDTTLKLAKDYRLGVYEPVSAATVQLADLVTLQQSANAQLTAGGSRAIRFYIDRRQHLPRLPNLLQSDMGKFLGGTTVNRLSQYAHPMSVEGGFDSPQMMYQKLHTARENNQNFITSLDEAANVQKTGGAGVKAGGAAAQGVTVTSPSGKSYTAQDQAAADRFVADAKAKGLWK